MGYSDLDDILEEALSDCKFGKFPRARITCEKAIQSKVFEQNSRVVPELYNFWPKTFNTVGDSNLKNIESFMRQQGKKSKSSTLICKPCNFYLDAKYFVTAELLDRKVQESS